MKIKYIIIITFSIYTTGTSLVFSQDVSNKIAIIDSARNFAEKIDDTKAPYSVLFADGQISRKKKVLWLFNSSKIIGGFAEKYTLQDTLLIKFWKGSSEFLNKEKTINTNMVESFVFKSEKLCFYKGSKFYDIKGQPDSLIYEIECYIDNEVILKSLKKGTIDQYDSSYLRQIIPRSKEAIKDKKMAL